MVSASSGCRARPGPACKCSPRRSLALGLGACAADICGRFQVDDYMKGVLYFYTDFIYIFCCASIMLWCQAAPPTHQEDDDEREDRSRSPASMRNASPAAMRANQAV